MKLHMKIRLTAIVLLLCSCVFGQAEIVLKNYDWDDVFDVSKYESHANHDKEGVIVLDRAIFEYNGLVVPQFIRHKIIWIEKESAIEKINQLELGESTSLFKARVVRPNGDVVSLVEEKSKYGASSSEDQKKAVEGIEEKVWVEIFYKQLYVPLSRRFVLINALDTELSQFFVYAKNTSSYLKEDHIKAYNGFSKKESICGKDFWGFEAQDIDAYSSREYSHDYHETPRVDVDFNRESAKEYAQDLKDIMDDRDSGWSSLKEVVEDELDAKDATDEEKVYAIENYVKNYINLVDGHDESLHTVLHILKKRQAHYKGLMTFYWAFFKAADLDYCVYGANNKDYIDLDSTFLMTSSVNEIIFYFPNSGIYLMPFDFHYRAAKNLPDYCEGTLALVIHDKVNKDNVGRIIRLPSNDVSFNLEMTQTKTVFNTENGLSRTNISKQFYGIPAVRHRGNLFYSDEEEKVNYILSVLTNSFDNAELSEEELKNDSIKCNFLAMDTIYFNGLIESDELFDPVSNGYLVNIPKLIGTQTSFYESGDRKNKIYVKSSKSYSHQLLFEVPKGYAIDKIENHNFNAEYKNEKGEIVASFHSEAELNGGLLRIIVSEFYLKGFYPAGDLEKFQNVVNSAYEFYNSQSRLLKQ